MASPQTCRKRTKQRPMERASVLTSDRAAQPLYLRQPVFVSDILSHPNWANFRSVVLQSGLRAAWSTPIMSQDGKVLGTFCMYYREVRHPGTNDIQFNRLRQRIAGIAIERERSRSALTKSEAELRTIIDAIPQLIIAVGADGTFLYANQAVRTTPA